LKSNGCAAFSCHTEFSQRLKILSSPAIEITQFAAAMSASQNPTKCLFHIQAELIWSFSKQHSAAWLAEKECPVQLLNVLLTNADLLPTFEGSSRSLKMKSLH
jgi:hypothetical protein